MESKCDLPKLPDMVMCGDHSSFTKTELNMKEKPDEDKRPTLQDRISPTTSRTGAGAGAAEARLRAASEHALRLVEARRRARSLEAVPRRDDFASGNRALVQAALGSFRWPPYLLAVWVLVLVLTHALHCLVSVLDRALPNLKRCSQYFRAWTEDAWRGGGERDAGRRLLPLLLATLTGCLYTIYCALFAVHAVAVWAVEPLAAEAEDKAGDLDAKITDYEDLAAVVKR